MDIGPSVLHYIAGLGKNGGEGIVTAQQALIAAEAVSAGEGVSAGGSGGDRGEFFARVGNVCVEL